MVMNVQQVIPDDPLSDNNEIDEFSLSTELALFDISWMKRNPDKFSRSFSTSKKSVSEQETAARLASFREADEEDRRHGLINGGVSTDLKLFEDPWVIKKKLTKTDLGTSCRLLISVDLFDDKILPHLDPACVAQIRTEAGLQVSLYDSDTHSMHEGIVLKRYQKLKGYVFMTNWKREFVTRRELYEEDEIGLFWCRDIFYFRLLSRKN